MNAATARCATPAALQNVLTDADPHAGPAAWLDRLVQRGLGRLPLPGRGATGQRWQMLAAVAEHDLALAKLYEGHTDALAILEELGEEFGEEAGEEAGSTWGTWAAEAPGGRVLIDSRADGTLVLNGAKCWCSGASHVSHGLLTAWWPDGRGPQLVRVAMKQPGVAIDTGVWHAVGMAGSSSVDVGFDQATAHAVGQVGQYLSRPGFWQGGAGIAACWYGGSLALAKALHRAVAHQAAPARSVFRLAALGKVDVVLQRTAAVLREAAVSIDAHPQDDACLVALRARLCAEDSAQTVLFEVGRALGAAPFCRDARFARAAADLPVFIRQSHAERDFAAVGDQLVLREGDPWLL
jgi:alkylation response protein AidB-like acyl-CoA dehydrogenase